MPVMANVAAVLVNAMLPLVVLVALNVPTEFAPFSTVPVVDEVVSNPLVDNEPVSEMLPAVDVAVIAPEVLLTAPFTASVPLDAVKPTVPLPTRTHRCANGFIGARSQADCAVCCGRDRTACSDRTGVAHRDRAVRRTIGDAGNGQCCRRVGQRDVAGGGVAIAGDVGCVEGADRIRAVQGFARGRS